jgi:hypothetical protein
MRWIAIASMLLAAPALAQEAEPDDEPVHEAPPGTPPPPVAPAPLPETPPPPPPEMRQNAAPLRGPFLPPPLPTTPEIDKLEHSGRAMRAGGGVMVALGAAMEISGQVLVIVSQLNATSTCTVTGGNTHCTTDYHLPELGTGIAFGLAAGGLIYGGLAVLSAGSGRVRKAQLMRFRLHPVVGTNTVGAQAALSF